MSRRRPLLNARQGASIPEVQILIMLLAVVATPLAALIWGARAEDNSFAARHNLLKLRQLVDQYRSDHHGRAPADLTDLKHASNADGERSSAGETSEAYPIGPYLVSLPENPLSEGTALQAQAVREVSHDPARPRDATHGNKGGWLYNPRTGGVWIDHHDLAQK